MRKLSGFRSVVLLAVMFPSLAMGNTNEEAPLLNETELSDYSAEQMFKAAKQSYVCSFLMHLAGQIKKAQRLRSYSVQLMSKDSVRSIGKNWNDVNFPGALVAYRLSNDYAKRFSISQKAAAGRLIAEDAKCAILNRITENTLNKKQSTASAAGGLANEQKRYWQGTTVGMFMDIEGQQFSYVAGFLDNAVYAYHAHGVSALKWQIECLADHPKKTNPVEITSSIVKKFKAVTKDFTHIRNEPVALFIVKELEHRCGQDKQREEKL
jgi:hypothetical protein